MKESLWSITYWDNRGTYHILKDLTVHQKEMFVSAAGSAYHTPLGMFFIDTSTMVVTEQQAI